jgi:hypothetical protein
MLRMPWAARLTRRVRQVVVGLVVLALLLMACLYLGSLPARLF